MTRRTLLLGAGTGALTVLVASCTPEPTPRPTVAPTPTPQPDGALPAPTFMARSAWSTDAFSFGAASFLPVGAQPQLREALSAPISERLFFAGEATDPEDAGTMRGAIRSGERVAQELRSAALNGERIAVVGAGLAGATAAAALVAGGATVSVFDGRDRVGGRTDSRVTPDWPLPVQLGGWLLSAQDEELRETFYSMNGRIADIGSAVWISNDGEVDTPETSFLESALAAAQKRAQDSSVAEAVTAVGGDPADPALAALLALQAATSGADADRASSWFPPALPPEGYAAPFIDFAALFEQHLEGAWVSLSSPVSRVAYDDTGVSLALGTGESLTFDRVVMTVPLGVLQSDTVEFDPPLPFAHRGAIAGLAMGHIETVWLQFEEPFWNSEADLWHLVGTDDVVRTWINLQPSTGENILVGVVGGSGVEAFAEMDDEELTSSILKTLQIFEAEPTSG